MANTIPDKLELLMNTKNNIYNAINDKLAIQNESMPDNTPFSQYKNYIDLMLGNNTILFSSINEMNNYAKPFENLYAIVYGDEYIGTFRYEDGTWIEEGKNTSDADATSDDIMEGKTAYINNEKVTGTIRNNGELNYTPSTNQQTIPEGYTTGGTIEEVTAEIDRNIIPGNIKEGVDILGILGTYTGSSLKVKPVYGAATFVTIPRAVNFGSYNTSLYFSMCDNYYFYWGSASGSYPYSFVYRINDDYSITEIYKNTSGTYVPSFYTMTAAYADEENNAVYCIMSYSYYSERVYTYLYKFDLTTKTFTNIGTFKCDGKDLEVGSLTRVNNEKDYFRNGATFYKFDYENLTITKSTLSTAGLSLRYNFVLDERYTLGVQYNTDQWYIIDGLTGQKSEGVALATGIPFFDPISMVACKGNTLYRVGTNLMLGEIIKTNFIPNFADISSHSNYTRYLQPIGNDYFIIDSYMYHFNRDNYTLTLEGTYTSLTTTGNVLRDIIKGYTYDSPYTQNHNIIITRPNTSALIGYLIEGKTYPCKKYSGASSDKIAAGYDVYDESLNIISGSMPNNGGLSYIPSTSQQFIPEGYTTGGTIEAVTSSIDSNIKPSNIRKDVTILGVTGIVEEKEQYQEKTATASGVVVPDAGYDALSRVNVAIPYQEKTATDNGEILPDNGYEAMGKVIVAVPLQEKSVDISKAGITEIYPDNEYKGISKVIINALSEGKTFIDLPIYDECNVEHLEQDTYGFEMDTEKHMWKSTNNGVNSSYSYAKITFKNDVVRDIVLTYSQSSESGCDFGVVSMLDVELSHDTSYASGTYQAILNSGGQVQNGTITFQNVPAGEHFITVKYRKDGSVHTGDDAVWFDFSNFTGESHEGRCPIYNFDSIEERDEFEAGQNDLAVIWNTTEFALDTFRYHSSGYWEDLTGRKIVKSDYQEALTLCKSILYDNNLSIEKEVEDG